MTYTAKVIEIIIASPSDVPGERQAVRDVIAEWNAVHARSVRTVLMPLGWETHSSPDLAGRPQQIINDRLLRHADMLVGIFWTRVGSPTGKAISGSIEEIETHLAAGKPAMLYFSNAPVRMDSVDTDQYNQLTTFKQWARAHGLVEFYDSLADFRALFSRQLQIMLNDNDYLRSVLGDSSSRSRPLPSVVVSPLELPQQSTPTLSAAARDLLAAAAAGSDGSIYVMHHLGGTAIQAGARDFTEGADQRTVARWEGAVRDLKALGLIVDRSGKGEFFQLTDLGYRAADT